MLPVLLQVGQVAAAGSGRNNYVRSLIYGHIALSVSNLHLMAGFHLGCAHNDIHVVLLQQKLHTFAHRFGDSARTLHHGLQVGLGRLGTDAIVGSMVDIVVYLGTLQ